MNNAIMDNSFELAVEVVKICQELQFKEKEFVLSKQLMRAGTAIGAHIREAEYAESKKEFNRKMKSAYKDANETLYWIELLSVSNYIDEKMSLTLQLKVKKLLEILKGNIKVEKSRIKE